ncbi:MAG: NCS2 family permease [Propionibacteriaceae bacterium]|nr:NCS2 family permease [Propionibacteriaceae bacterium]
MPQPTSGKFTIDGWFGIKRHGSTLNREVRGGLVTFLTMAYIIVLNPIIIGTATDIEGRLVNGMLPAEEGAVGASMGAVAAATALVAGVMTILMGIVGRYPVALATGLGINSMVGYVLTNFMPWKAAMGVVVWDGILITILVFTGFREAVFRAVPKALRFAISAGIGLFIAFIGLVDAGIIRTGSGTITSFGISTSIDGFPMLIFVLGFFVLLALHTKKVRGAILIAIVGATAVAIIAQSIHPIGTQAGGDVTGWSLNVPQLLDNFGAPDLSLLGRIDLFGGFKSWTLNAEGTAMAGSFSFASIITGVMFVFSLLLADFFDTMGTVVAIGTEGNLLNDAGEPEHLREILLVDSLGAIAGGAASVSSNTSYIESASGVGDGARTGFANIITGVAFLATVFISPLTNMVPSEAVAPALVFVGFLMTTQLGEVPWKEPTLAIPAYVIAILMPFGYSITVGIGGGFITYVLLQIVSGKAKNVHPIMWLSAAMFALYFAQGPLLRLITG